MKKISIVLVLLLVAASFGYSQGLGLKSVKPKIGLIFPKSPWETGFNVGAGVDLGEVTSNLHLVPSLAYWHSSVNTFGLSNFQLAADVEYYLQNVKGLYFGGGISVNFFSGDIDSVTRFGLGFLGGYKFPLESVTLFGQAKYNVISDFNTFELVIGAEFPLK